MYLNDGQAVHPGHFPKAKKKCFDADEVVQSFPAVPASEPKWPTYPCEGCPSSGDSSVVPAASQDLNL